MTLKELGVMGIHWLIKECVEEQVKEEKKLSWRIWD